MARAVGTGTCGRGVFVVRLGPWNDGIGGNEGTGPILRAPASGTHERAGPGTAL